METSPKLRYKIKSELKKLNNDVLHWFLHFKVNEHKLYKECEDWCIYVSKGVRLIHPNCYKVNVGRFIGVWPKVIKNNKVIFSVDFYHEETYKDWFEAEE